MQKNLPPNTDLSMEGDHLRPDKVWMPILALFFSVGLPTLLFFVSSEILRDLLEVLLLMFLISPVVGFFLGVTSLAMGKKQIGRVGKVIAIIAIAVPISFVLFIVLAFTTPGLINLM